MMQDGFKAKLFADDLKSYNSFDFRNNPIAVQYSLDSISDWSDMWQLKLAIKKCGSLLITHNSRPFDAATLNINDEPLSVLDCVRDLGVLVDSNLSFSSHIDNVIAKSKQRAYLIFKSFESREIDLFVFAYKTYILPILDYCCSVWSPYKLTDINRLENVQRSYTKKLKGQWYLPYKQRLLNCHLTSLELRRLIYDIVLCFKIIHNLVAIDFSDFFEFDLNRRTRGHNFKLRIPKCKSRFRFNFFAVRVVPVWNSLPNEFVNCSSVRHLKRLLIGYNLSAFLSSDFDSFLS